MIVTPLAGAVAPELDDVRAACRAATTRLVTSGARHLVVVGVDEHTRDLEPPYLGSFAPWGLPVEVALGAPVAGPPPGGGEPRAVKLPLSLSVGGWLLAAVAGGASAGVSCRMVTVGWDEPVRRCRQRGAELGTAEPWALLVMGDGSACRGDKAPGYHDPRAQPYDDAVAAALAGADTEALLNLDPALSAELAVAGRAPWQVLAGAVQATGARWRGELSYYAAPYGVAYFVATWQPGS